MVKKSLTAWGAVALATFTLGSQFAGADDRPVLREAVPTVAAQDGGSAYRAKEILGAAVSLDGGASVGTIDDIVLDNGGNVDYLIVVNNDRKLVTAPWDAAAFDVRQRRAVIHIAPEQFRQIPTYTTAQYPVFTTPTYRTQVYKYYGLTPGQQRRINQRMDRHDRRDDRRDDRDRRPNR